MATAPQSRRFSSAAALLTLAVLVLGIWATSIWWFPPLLKLLGKTPESPEKKSASGVLSKMELSPQARETLGIKVEPLKHSPYERVIPIPGRAVVVPGIGQREITSPSSGVVNDILIREGQLVAPGQALFEVKLVHDEAVKGQMELLDALAEKEIVDADLKRLRELDKQTPGAVQGTRILEKAYKQRQLNHLIASRREMLILLGLPASAIDQMITAHSERPIDESDDDHTDYRKRLLLDKLTISAPDVSVMGSKDMRFLVEKLHVIHGKHVESGDVLCQLGDYQKLYIEGEAFERDLETIRQARDKGWPVAAAVEIRGGVPVVLTDLKLSYIAPQVDAEARSAKFYVELDNEIRERPALDTEPSRLDWTYQPGQRMELRVPVERIPDALKVPVEAVARDGLDNYVFQVSGKMFTRQPVKVLHRDEDYVVLAEDRQITVGVPVAMNGAYQLQLSLLNKSMDPTAISHGHAH